MDKQIDKQNAYRPLAQLIAPGWSEDTIIANGIHQHFYRTGRGRRPPVILLHGFMENGISWLRVARALSIDYDVIMPDARAHGHSAGPESGFTPELLADDVAALLETLKLERPFLIGRSNGAVTAVLVAAAHPDRVLEEPPAGGMPRPALRQEQVQEQNWFQAWLQWMQRLDHMTHRERMTAAKLAASWSQGQVVRMAEAGHIISRGRPYEKFMGHLQSRLGTWRL